MEIPRPSSLALNSFRVGLEKNIYYPGEVMRLVVGGVGGVGGDGGDGGVGGVGGDGGVGKFI